MIWFLSLNLQVAITWPNSRSQRVLSETFAPKPREHGPNPNSQSSYQNCPDGGQRTGSVVGLYRPSPLPRNRELLHCMSPVVVGPTLPRNPAARSAVPSLTSGIP